MSRDSIVIITRSRKRCTRLRERFNRDGRSATTKVVTASELLQGIDDSDVWVFLLDHDMPEADAEKIFCYLEQFAPHIPVVPGRQDKHRSEP